MPFKHVEPRTPSRFLTRSLLVGAAVVVAAAVLGGYVSTLPFTLRVDGQRAVVPANTTVADLRQAGHFSAADGDVIAIDGSVAKEGGGERSRIYRNGEEVREDQVVYRGDTLYSEEGSDTIETTQVAEVPVPYGTSVEGSGPLTKLVSVGRAGLKRVVRGSVSHIEVTATVLVLPVDEVLRRTPAQPGSKLVALTFDDGPWPGQTERILTILAEEDVHATFFMLGGQVKRHPALARAVRDGGHLLGNHSLGHQRFDSIPPKEIRREVKGGRVAIQRATGVLTPWIRPPYGAMDKAAWQQVRRLRQKTVMWDVDSNDWRKPGAKKIAKSVVKAVKPGSIVLFHDGGGDRSQTAAALRSVIRQLKAKGYVFVTVEELAQADGVKKAPAAKAAETGTPKRH